MGSLQPEPVSQRYVQVVHLRRTETFLAVLVPTAAEALVAALLLVDRQAESLPAAA